ncbi:MAG: pilus assembly protein PilQ, partial [Sulfurihydrogenibium sp.]
MNNKAVKFTLATLCLFSISYAEKIKLEFTNAKLSTVVDAISQVSKVNILWDKNAIAKKDSLTSISIQKPVNDLFILNKILLENGLILVKDKKSDIYYVKQADETNIAFPPEVTPVLGTDPFNKVVKFIESIKTENAILDYDTKTLTIYYKDIKENIDRVKEFLGPYSKYVLQEAKDKADVINKKGKPITKEYPLSYEDYKSIEQELLNNMSIFGKVEYDKNRGRLVITDLAENIQKITPLISKKIQGKIVTRCFYVRELEPGEIFYKIKFGELSEVGSVNFLYKGFDIQTITASPGQPPQVVSLSKTLNEGSVKETATEGQPQEPTAKKSISGGYAINSLPRICISDTPEVIDKIKYKYYNELLDKPYQIMIEARIVEISSNSLKDLGIQWGGVASNIDNNNTKLIAGTNSTSSLAAFRRYIDNGKDQYSSSYAVDFPANILAPGGFSIGFIFGGLQNFLDIRLSALQRVGKSKLLSAPKILTTDGETALIRQGFEIPYITGATAT